MQTIKSVRIVHIGGLMTYLLWNHRTLDISNLPAGWHIMVSWLNEYSYLSQVICLRRGKEYIPLHPSHWHFYSWKYSTSWAPLLSKYFYRIVWAIRLSCSIYGWRVKFSCYHVWCAQCVIRSQKAAHWQCVWWCQLWGVGISHFWVCERWLS